MIAAQKPAPDFLRDYPESVRDIAVRFLGTIDVETDAATAAKHNTNRQTELVRAFRQQLNKPQTVALLSDLITHGDARLKTSDVKKKVVGLVALHRAYVAHPTTKSEVLNFPNWETKGILELAKKSADDEDDFDLWKSAVEAEKKHQASKRAKKRRGVLTMNGMSKGTQAYAAELIRKRANRLRKAEEKEQALASTEKMEQDFARASRENESLRQQVATAESKMQASATAAEMVCSVPSCGESIFCCCSALVDFGSQTQPRHIHR